MDVSLNKTAKGTFLDVPQSSRDGANDDLKNAPFSYKETILKMAYYGTSNNVFELRIEKCIESPSTMKAFKSSTITPSLSVGPTAKFIYTKLRIKFKKV